MTGLGPLTPQPADGFIPATPTAKPAFPFQVGLNDSSIVFPILYIGDVPQKVEGLQRIDVQLPTVLPPTILPQLVVTTENITAGGVLPRGVFLFYQ